MFRFLFFVLSFIVFNVMLYGRLVFRRHLEQFWKTNRLCFSEVLLFSNCYVTTSVMLLKQSENVFPLDKDVNISQDTDDKKP